MNLPVGEVISRGISVDSKDVKRLIEGFFDKGFSGYIINTLEGVSGIEEGVILFRSGKPVGALYDYDLHGLTVFGDKALVQVFNSFAAEYIVADVVSLTDQQVDLVLAFNDKSKLGKKIDKKEAGKLIPRVYSLEYAKNILKNTDESSKSKGDIFNKFGLGQLSD